MNVVDLVVRPCDVESSLHLPSCLSACVCLYFPYCYWAYLTAGARALGLPSDSVHLLVLTAIHLPRHHVTLCVLCNCELLTTVVGFTILEIALPW